MNDGIKKLIKDLYESDAYQKLVDYYKQDNIFSIIHAARLENIHSAFFAWLFDAQKHHGMGDNALRSLLRLYSTKYKGEEIEWANAFLLGDYTISDISVTTEKSVEKSVKKNSKPSRMDIYVEAILVPNQSWNDTELKPRKLMLCVENKIYSDEHDGQTITYHNYLVQNANDSLNYDNNADTPPLLVELFLSPSSEKKPQADSFISVTYQDILHSVLEPMLNINDITDSAKYYINDYIRALGRPTLTLIQNESDKASNQKNKLYSVLAISKREKKTLGEIYKMPIFKMAYIANQGLDKKVLQKEEWNEFSTDEVENNKALLNQLWISNSELFEAVAIICGGLPVEVENNRDTTKYTIKYAGNILNLKNKSGSFRKASKTEASFLIFKAWCEWWKEIHHGEKPSYDEINKVFPIELNGYYNNTKYFNHLFISCTDKGFEDQYKKHLNFNFYTDDEHKLHLKDGEYYSLKMWRKSDFDNLKEYVDSKLIDFKNKLEIIEY